MKIQIELLDEPSSYKLQLLAVDKYIKENTISSSYLGSSIEELPIIKTTLKTNGVKIKLHETWREFHVSCKKTKAGMYKFKVWNA